MQNQWLHQNELPFDKKLNLVFRVRLLFFFLVHCISLYTQKWLGRGLLPFMMEINKFSCITSIEYLQLFFFLVSLMSFAIEQTSCHATLFHVDCMPHLPVLDKDIWWWWSQCNPGLQGWLWYLAIRFRVGNKEPSYESFPSSCCVYSTRFLRYSHSKGRTILHIVTVSLMPCCTFLIQIPLQL